MCLDKVYSVTVKPGSQFRIVAATGNIEISLNEIPDPSSVFGYPGDVVSLKSTGTLGGSARITSLDPSCTDQLLISFTTDATTGSCAPPFPGLPDTIHTYIDSIGLLIQADGRSLNTFVLAPTNGVELGDSISGTWHPGFFGMSYIYFRAGNVSGYVKIEIEDVNTGAKDTTVLNIQEASEPVEDVALTNTQVTARERLGLAAGNHAIATITRAAPTTDRLLIKFVLRPNTNAAYSAEIDDARVYLASDLSQSIGGINDVIDIYLEPNQASIALALAVSPNDLEHEGTEGMIAEIDTAYVVDMAGAPTGQTVTVAGSTTMHEIENDDERISSGTFLTDDSGYDEFVGMGPYVTSNALIGSVEPGQDHIMLSTEGFEFGTNTEFQVTYGTGISIIIEVGDNLLKPKGEKK